MKHLSVGSVAVRANVFLNHGIPEYSLEPVRVVLQHDSLGTFFDTGKRFMSAWHGELHETEAEARQHLAARLLASSWPKEHVRRLVAELTKEKTCLPSPVAVG